MRKKALKKDFRMEVRKSMNRFVSILFIVAMGVAMFSGIHSSAPDMRFTSDEYFDETNLMDIRVVGTLGLTEDDMEALRQLEGVQLVEPGYMTDVLCEKQEKQTVLHIESMLDTINQVTLTEGRLPENRGECFLDREYMLQYGYQIGDSIEVRLPDEEENDAEQESEDVSETEKEAGNKNEEVTERDTEEEDTPVLRTTTFTIVGSGNSSSYLSYNRGSSSLGSGEVAGFMYILPEDFDSEVYMAAYLTVEGAGEAVAYTEEYEQLIERVLEGAESIQDVRCEIRYRDVVEEAQEVLDEHMADLAEGESELEEARQDLADGRKEAETELANAKADLENGESELEEGKLELQEKEQELADAKQQLAEGEAEIASQEAQLQSAKQQLESGETQLKSAEQQLKANQAEYDSTASSAAAQLDAGQKQIDTKKQEIAAGLAQLESEERNLEAAEQQSSEAAATLAVSQAEYDAGAAALAEGEETYAANKAALDAAWEEYNANAAAYDAEKQNYDAGVANLEVLKGQKDTAISAAGEKRASAETLASQNSILQSEIDTIKGEMSGLESQISTLSAEIGDAETQIDALQEQLSQEEAKGEEASEETKTDLQNQIATAQADLQSKKDGLTAVQNDLAAKSSAATEKEQAISNNTTAIETAQSEADALEAEAAGLEPTITQLSEQLEKAKPELEEAGQNLAAAKVPLDQNTAALASARAELDAQAVTLAAAKEELDSGWTALKTGESEIAAGRQLLEQNKSQLESGQQEIEENQKKIDAGRDELASGKAQLDAAWEELNSNKAQLESSRTQITAGETQLAQGKQTLADSKSQISDGEQQIADAWSEIEENEQKIKDGWEEYEEGKKEAESELQDGEKEISEAEADLVEAREKLEDAQKEIDEIKQPEWYVNDRAVYPEYSGYGENADRIRNIGKVFPVLFFLVAALISLTTMTRMVEEQRTQIGTLKALGYSKMNIASKYMKYALFATLGGSLLGILVGEKVLPYVIVWAYGMLYPNLRSPVIPYNWEYGLIATGAALVCTLGATFAACYKELAATPAVLMRPPSPKEGKRVLLEYLPFIWKRLTFTWKSTIRNLFRYKKRFFMTIIGIGGCMGLLLVGFGLKDSIVGIGTLQYDHLQLYDLMVILDPDGSPEEQKELEDYLRGKVGSDMVKKVYAQMISVTDGKKEYNPYLYVLENTENLENFLIFRDRISHEEYQLTDEGVIINEKLASMMKLEAGDEVIISDDDKGNLTVPVTSVVENYLSHYVYLTPKVYEQIYGETPEYNTILVTLSSQDQAEIQKMGEEILNMDGALNVTYSYSLASQLEDMLGSLDVVIGVLIICAGMLAFVVLYNLNNININERKRELATLKVLGFYDGEVAAYVYRENMLLTAIGALLGIGMGIVLHRFIITTVEVDNCMFGRNINPISFVYGILFTFAFSAIVNGVMYFKLKKIDMVESLKSVE